MTSRESFVSLCLRSLINLLNSCARADMATVKTAHATNSIRARSRAAPARPDPSAPDRKVVYKPVVDNPLGVHWPPLPASVRNEILNQLLELIQHSAEGPGLGAGEKAARKDGSTGPPGRTTASELRQLHSEKVAARARLAPL